MKSPGDITEKLTLSKDEQVAIEQLRQLMARYTIAGDEYDAETYLSCFSENAILQFDHFPGKGELRLEGKVAIEQHVTGFFDGLKNGSFQLPGGFARHHLTTSQIDLQSPDHAEAKTYCIVCTANGAEHSGRYLDRFRLVNGKWLIEYRRWTIDK